MGDSALASTTVKPVRADLYFSTERPSDSWKLEIWDQCELSRMEMESSAASSASSRSDGAGLAGLALSVGFLASSWASLTSSVLVAVVVVEIGSMEEAGVTMWTESNY